MNYSQDFSAADDVYAPVHDQLLLGLPPLLIVLLALLVLAAGGVGWVIGRHRRTDGASDAAAIWKSVDDAIRAAMTVHSDGLRDKAAALSRVIDDRLGRTLAIAGGLKAAAALKTALKDPEPAKSPVPGATKPHHADKAHTPSETDPHPAAVTIERANQVVIHAPPHTDPGGHVPRPAPTEAERRDAIRKAVSELNDHWRLKEARIQEIEAAHEALSAKS